MMADVYVNQLVNQIYIYKYNCKYRTNLQCTICLCKCKLNIEGVPHLRRAADKMLTGPFLINMIPLADAVLNGGNPVPEGLEPEFGKIVL